MIETKSIGREIIRLKIFLNMNKSEPEPNRNYDIVAKWMTRNLDATATVEKCQIIN